jgi:hypothetical protein
MEHLTEHLRTLGLSPDATLQEALAAHQDLIRVWHPDRFESDPKLKAKALEQTVRINLAIAAVRKDLKNPRPKSSPLRASTHHASQASSPPRRPTEHSHLASPTLLIHQPTRATILQTLLGGAILYLGILLVTQFCGKAAPQTALGLVLAAYGFSVLLLALAILCFKTPIIAINQLVLHILGTPSIPVVEISGAHVLVSQRGTALAISCSPEYVRTLPIARRWLMRFRHLVRGYHFEFNASLLDHHPTHVVQALNAMAIFDAPSQPLRPSARSWGTHANTLATLCLTIAVVRCLATEEHQLISLVPYLVLFALFRSVATIQTAVLGHPTRTPSAH